MSPSPEPAPESDALRFTALWEAPAGRLLAYALRHTDREALGSFCQEAPDAKPIAFDSLE